ncbi:DNA polymerase IV [Haloarcula pellucida]|uniref:DNA polymerase IV n=1 Tax=Haloarcula pellucida TaxID=1427151 RepID=A0A830GL16_9EURY|nr:DNA polymerase IV [Halomicroarcula pellucida]MBX0347620.1 DNA polymerase IV [Halomicroarcula pellucida]GGN89615.1 DNA polymerase IV [Halomicroarcula pellucida]
MDAARLPGTSATDQVVAHVDMDCFYAACERRREPALEGEPLVVGMGYENGEAHGAVATASYEAREFGVESAMAISEALERLPRKVEAAEDPEMSVEEAGYYRPVDMDHYEAVASEVKDVLHDVAEMVREVSIDEAYLDVTDDVSWDEAESWADTLKSTIESAVGVVASVGVAPTMSAAKVASDYDKPDGLVVVGPGEVREFFADLPVEEVHGVGPVTARELAALDIETAGDLAAADPETVAERFGERGLEIRRYARGEDTRTVTPKGDPKSLSRESAFTDAVEDTDQKRQKIETLASAVADRAHRKEARYQTIGIKVVEPPFDVNTRARSLPGPVDDADLVESVALDLLTEFEDAAVRKVGVRVSNLDFSVGEQARLSGFDGADASAGDSETTADGAAPESDWEGQVSLTEFGDTPTGRDEDASSANRDGQVSLDDFD